MELEKRQDQVFRRVRRAMANPAAQSKSVLDNMSDLLTTVMILHFLFVFLDLAVELVDQTINRRVKILVNGFNENVLAGEMNGNFGFLLEFVYR